MSWQVVIRRLKPAADELAADFIKTHGSYSGLFAAYRALVEGDTSFVKTAAPHIRYHYHFMKIIRYLHKKFPYHTVFFKRMGFWTWVVLMENFYIVSVMKRCLEYKRWIARETADEPKELDIMQYHHLRLDPAVCEFHLSSFAPPIKPTYSVTTVGVCYPSNQAYRHIVSHFGAFHVPRPKTETWIHHYATSDLLTGAMDPVYRVLSGEDLSALTPATNPGAVKPHEMINWFSPGGAVLDIEMGWRRNVWPRPTESVCVAPDYSNVEEDDEDNYYALLEFRADPEASLMRRIKEKLGFLSKKERNDIFKQYLKRQEEEIELDHLREMDGVNAVDAAAMWEQDEQAEDEEDAAVPDIDYGYVPAHPVLSEGETWSEFWEYYYSMTISERNKFVEALAWYGYNLALHVKWYAIRQEEAEMIKKGEATLDPNAPIFPPNPAANLKLRDHKPHVLQAFGILPWGNHFMSTMHLATLVIHTTKKMVKIMAKEAREQAQTAASSATVPANAAQILADFDEAYKLMESVNHTLVQAEQMAATWLSRAIKARIFYPDTDELTDYEEEEMPEEYVPAESKPKKKGKGKKKKKKGKGKKEEAEAEEKAAEPDSEAEEDEEEKKKEEEQPKKGKKKAKKAKKDKKGKGRAVSPHPESDADAEPALPTSTTTTTTTTNLPPAPAADQAGTTTTNPPIPGIDLFPFPAPAPAACLASLADQPHAPRAEKEKEKEKEEKEEKKTPEFWAARFERQDDEAERPAHPARGGVPHDRRYVTGREGVPRRL